MIQNTLFVTQTTPFVNPMAYNTLFFAIYGGGWKFHNLNMILGQLKMGEHIANIYVYVWYIRARQKIDWCAELRFVATVTTSGRVKFVPAV